MLLRVFLITVISWTTGLTSMAGAVIVYPKGGGEPIKGYLVRQSPEAVVVAVPQPDGTTVERVVARELIDDVLVTVSQERLATLKSDNPQAYRDYAEELADKKTDPDARAVSLRLYLIAAHLEPDRLGRSCLLGMVGLGRTPAEKRKFRAMAYLLDPDRDARLLKEVDDETPTRPSLPHGAATDLAECLRLLRRDLRPQALRSAQREDVKANFEKIRSILTYDEFARLCESRKTLTPDQLKRILLAEASLIRVGGGSGEPPKVGTPKTGASWSQVMTTSPPPPVPSLSLETLTEFDPRECEYRDGKWVQP
jgi:hypothetical protein